MSRHPYTYAADYIRMLVIEPISRSDASAIRSGIAKAINMDDKILAEKLSLYFQVHEQELSEKKTQEWLARVDRFNR